MPKKDESSQSIPSILESAVNAIREHEKQLDRIINGLEKVKENLSLNFEKTNTKIDNDAKRIEILENDFHKLKSA